MEEVEEDQRPINQYRSRRDDELLRRISLHLDSSILTRSVSVGLSLQYWGWLGLREEQPEFGSLPVHFNRHHPPRAASDYGILA